MLYTVSHSNQNLLSYCYTHYHGDFPTVNCVSLFICRYMVAKQSEIQHVHLWIHIPGHLWLKVPYLSSSCSAQFVNFQTRFCNHNLPLSIDHRKQLEEAEKPVQSINA